MGMFSHHEMVVTVATLPLPDADGFVSTVQEKALPQVLGLATACLGVMLAVLLIRSFTNK